MRTLPGGPHPLSTWSDARTGPARTSPPRGDRGLGRTAVGRIVTLRNDLFRLLERRYLPQQERALYSLTARICGLLAIASSDFYGRYDAAADQCRTAWILTEIADSADLASWVRSLQSEISFWAGQWAEAALLADQALALSVTESGRARARSMKVRALGRMGNIEGVRAVATRPRPSTPSLPDLDDETGVVHFSAANEIRCTGSALLWAGDPSSAIRELELALQMYLADQPDDFAVLSATRLDLALAQTHHGNLDKAAEVLDSILGTESERLAGTNRRIQELMLVLSSGPYQSSTAALELAGRLHTFAAAP